MSLSCSYRVKSSSRLQHLKQSYLLKYHHIEWADCTKTILGIFFQRTIHLPPTARPNALLPNLYAYTFVHTRAILPCCIFGTCSSMRMPLYPDRGLPLSPNIVLHVRPQISTERPPLFIVGLIWYLQSCFITLIQDFNLNLSITHSSFGTNWQGTLVVFPFST